MGFLGPPARLQNADLARYRKGRLGGELSPARTLGEKALQLLASVTLQFVLVSLRALAVPFGRLFALYLYMGKSAVTLCVAVERQLLKTVGWLGGTGFTREDSRLGRWAHHYFGADVKRWHVGLGALVLGGVVHGVVKAVRNSLDERLKVKRMLRRLMDHASTYEEWRAHAETLERLEGDEQAVPEHEDYDRKLLNEKLRHLKRMRGTGNPREMMLALRIDLIRNVANIAKSQKHRQNFVTVPPLIKAYIKEVQQHLETIAAWPELELPLDEKISFFRVTRHAFGRTALLLSGGGGLGTFHLGVCKGLFERKLLPRVLAGSSVGSIVCAVIGTRTDEELARTFADLDKFDIGFFQNSTAMDLVRHAMTQGSLQNIKHMVVKLRQLVGDCTFLEAFERTGRILNVTVCPADTNEPPRLLNYMTAPQALVWSAVAASSSFPGLYPPQHLLGRNSRGDPIRLGHGGSDSMQRRWRDGSLEFDLPVQTLAEMFNCNHFLVSQTNPHIVPLVNLKMAVPHKWGTIMEAELKHRLQVMQWLLPEWKVTKYLTLFTQPWEGDVTFTLPSMLWNLRKTIVNPSTRDLIRATQIGEHSTWEKMAAMECNCTIEAALDLCSSRLTSRARGQSLASIGGKVPSWLHMPGPMVSMMPPSGKSWGDGISDNEGPAVPSWGDFSALGGPLATPPVRGAHAHRGSVLMGGSGTYAGELGLGSEPVAEDRAAEDRAAAEEQAANPSARHRHGSAGSLPAPGSVPLGGMSLAAATAVVNGRGSLSAAHRAQLPAIPSVHSSDGDGTEAFDSASSVVGGGGAGCAGGAGTPGAAPATPRQGPVPGPSVTPPLTSSGTLRRDGAPSASSTGISRRSSVLRGLNLLSHPGDAEGEVVVKSSSPPATTNGAHPSGSGQASVGPTPSLGPSVRSSFDAGAALGGAGGDAGALHGHRRSQGHGHASGIPRHHTHAPDAHWTDVQRQHSGGPAGPGSQPSLHPAGLQSAHSLGPGEDARSLTIPPPGTGSSSACEGSPMSASPPRPAAEMATEEQLLALAAMDISSMTDSGDVWGAFLPLAGTSLHLTAKNNPQASAAAAGAALGNAGGEGSGDGIDFFAY